MYPHVKTAESRNRDFSSAFPQTEGVIYADNPRAAAVAKFRELADKLERGELNGASCQWNDNPDQPAMVFVECHPVVDGKRTATLHRCTFQPAANRMRLIAQE
jgi:hypothetical protein